MGLLTLALIIDMFVGDPDWLWKRLPHPVVLIGKWINLFDRLRDHEGAGAWCRRIGLESRHVVEQFFGIVLLLSMFVLCLMFSRLIMGLGSLGWLIELILVAILVAQRSLYDHVGRVVVALKGQGLQAARKQVSMIVGRDVSKLNESGISKAAIESLAENFSDGVVAPVLWYAVAGLPGILFYKAVNTADSMIGHHNDRFEYFGKPAARLDDWMNWPASRLSTVLVVVSVALARGGSAASAVWKATLRDASNHRSPNAGWPETSFAAALNLSLGGPRQYEDDLIDAEFLYSEGRDIAKPADVEKSLSLFLRSCICLIGFCGAGWLFFG